ncbi:TonB-dependent receptor [Roseivivax marinus]|uniref:TonB-dependent receptor plug domain-containing protein n=1 Tax=Roseivivax marinus TaxID=1379903 RepID=UPI001F036371|nr:TonB-dependent receptor [Roseivivax marinus]UMA65738.1 TonB-dependent receptor [Roseivivax marinus]
MRLSVSAAALCVAAIAISRPAAAQDEVVDLGTLTFTANAAPTALSETGATVEVVETQDLETAPDLSLSDYLDTLPGVSTTQNGGLGTVGSVRLRGLPPRYVPVVIDGIDVTDPTGPQVQYDWGNLTVAGVNRVEVLKGSQSALYGSEAIGGVVSVTTARAPASAGTEGSVSLEAGSYDTRRGSLSLGAATDRAGIALSFSRVVTDGFSAVEADGYDEDDGYEGSRLSFDAYVDVTPDVRLGLSGFGLNAEGEYDATYGADPEDGTSETETRAIRAYAEVTTGPVDHLFEATRYRTDRTTSANGFESSFEGERETVSYRGSWIATDAVTLSFGAERTEESAESAPEDVTTRAVYAEALWTATPDLDLSLALRHDDHSEFGGETTARAAAAWRFGDGMTLRGVLGSGFRAPSLYELYNPDYGNTGLDPESSRSAEIGLQKDFTSGATVRATAFYTEIDDLIGFEFPAGYIQTPGTSVTQGLELAASTPLGDRLSLRGNFTYTDARDQNDDPLANVPRYDLNLALDAAITPKLTGTLQVRHAADFPDVNNATFTGLSEVDAFTVVNAQAAYQVREGVEAYLRIENLGGVEYQRVPDYATSDRAAYFGVRASF